MRRNKSVLTLDERRDMMDKILVVAQERLLKHKLSGVKFKQIADDIGIPKTRISEVYKRVYISKNTLSLLLKHKYLDPSDIDAAGLTDVQMVAVRKAIGQA